jgi:hypothetical protein
MAPGSDEILANSYSVQKAVRNLGRAGVDGACYGAAVWVSYMLAKLVMEAGMTDEQFKNAEGFLGMAMVGVGTPGLYKLGKRTVSALFGKDGRLTGMEALEQTHLHRRRQHIEAGRIAAMPEYIRTPVEMIDRELLPMFAAAAATADTPDIKALGRARRLMRWQKELLIERPDKLQRVERWVTEAGRKELLAHMYEEMQFYEGDPQLVNKLVSVLVGACARSAEVEVRHSRPGSLDVREPAQAPIRQNGQETEAAPSKQRSASKRLSDQDDWHQWDSVPAIPKRGMILLGFPGTGKGRFTGKTIPDVLGLPVQELVVPPLELGGLQELLAKGWPAIVNEDYVTREEDLLGLIGLALILAACRNCFLLFNEVRLDDLQGLKRLLEPMLALLDARCLNTSFQFNDVTILLALNKVDAGESCSSDEADRLPDALDDRMDTAFFRESSRQVKRDAAVKEYRAYASRFCLPLKDTGEPVLDAGQQQRMQETFKAVLDALVDLHHGVSPGARLHVPVHAVVEQMVVRLQMEKFYGADWWKPLESRGAGPMTAASMRAFVQDHFRDKRARNPFHPGAAVVSAPDASTEGRADSVPDPAHFDLGNVYGEEDYLGEGR